VLAVGVDDEDVLAGRTADAGLHRGPVALVVRVARDDGARRRGAGARLVSRPVVDDDDLVPTVRRPRARPPVADRLGSRKAGMMTDVVEGSATRVS